MTANFYEKLSDLRAAQTETHTLLRGLTEKVEKYVDVDDARHDELVEFRLESSKHLSSVATIVQDIKKEVDCAVNKDIPELQKKQAGHAATLNIHSWFMRAVIGVTLLAVLGGTVTTLATCELSQAKAESAGFLIEDAGLVDSDIDRGDQ